MTVAQDNKPLHKQDVYPKSKTGGKNENEYKTEQ